MGSLDTLDGHHYDMPRAVPQQQDVHYNSQTELHNCQIRMDSLHTLDGTHYDMPRAVLQHRDDHYNSHSELPNCQGLQDLHQDAPRAF